MAKMVSHTSGQVATRHRIDAQRAIVASLPPGSPGHRLATKVLLMLEDSLHLMMEIDALMVEAERLKDEAGG